MGKEGGTQVAPLSREAPGEVPVLAPPKVPRHAGFPRGEHRESRHRPTTHFTEEKAEASEEVGGPLSSRGGGRPPGPGQATGTSLPLSPQPSRPMPAWVKLLLL